MWCFIGGVAIFIVLFIIWRWTSVARGARQRDERILKLLDPIGKKLAVGEFVTPNEVLELAKRPEVRFMLFSALKQMKRTELIPSDFSSPIKQAESALVYWLMHPNEFQDPPESIEYIQEVILPLNGNNAKFHIFRFRMATGHCAAKQGWLLGLVGPMDEKQEPYSFLPGAFSRIDIEGSITPLELVQWYVDMLKQKDMET